jgi:hypothetical protein
MPEKFTKNKESTPKSPELIKKVFEIGIATRL